MPSSLEWSLLITIANIVVVVIVYKIGKKVGRGEVYEDLAKKR